MVIFTECYELIFCDQAPGEFVVAVFALIGDALL
jgi:hypothetical protein